MGAMGAMDDGVGLEAEATDRYTAGNHAGALEAFESAHRAYRAERDALGAARTARTVGWLRGWIHGDWIVHDAWMRRAADVLGSASEGRARAWRLLDEARRGSDLAHQRAAYEEVIALARDAGDDDLACEAVASLGMMLVFSGLVEEGMGHLDRALAALCGGDVRELPVVEGCLCGLFHACERTADVDRAEQWLRSAGDVIRGRRLVAVAGYCRAHYGGILTAAGRWAEAESELEAAIADLPPGTAVRHHALCRLADLRLRQDRPREAAALLDECGGHADATRPRVVLHLSRGQNEPALALLEVAIAAAGEAHDLLPLLVLQVEARLQAEDIDAADRTARQLSELAVAQPSAYLRGIGGAAVGRAAQRRGDVDAAVSCLRAAVDDLRSARTPYELAEARLALAAVLSTGQPTLAASEAAEAAATFDALGAPQRALAARQVLASTGVDRHTAGREMEATGSPAPAELSAREREVLALVARGMKNAEIAAALFISPKTAEHHVGSILSKLGVPNRAAAAVYAMRAPDHAGAG